MKRPQPIPTTMLGQRVRDGSYPYRAHRTCADWSSDEPDAFRPIGEIARDLIQKMEVAA